MAIRILSSENISGEVLIASGKYLSWGTAGATSIEGSTVSNKLQFRTNSTNAVIIDSSQNVGIGNFTNPSDGNLVVKKDGLNTGIPNSLTSASFSESGGQLKGLTIGYRTDETTAVIAARTATGDIAFMGYDGGWLETARFTNDNKLGIGTNDPDGKVHIFKGSNGGTTLGTASDELVLENDTDCGLTIRSGADSTGVVSFASPTDHNVGQLYYNHDDDSMVIRTNDAIRTIIGSSGIMYIMGATASTNNSLQLQYNSTAGSAEIYSKSTGGNTTFEFYTSNSGTTTQKFNIGSSGDVKITTNGKFLQGVRNTGSATIDMIGFGAGTDRLQIKGGTSGGAESIAFFDTAGQMATFYNSRFGIGNTTPKFALNTNLAMEGASLAYLDGTSNNQTTTNNIGVTHNASGFGGTNGVQGGLFLANNNNANNAPSPIIFFGARSASNTYNHAYAAIYGVKTGGGADSNWNVGELTFATGDGTGPKRRMTIDKDGDVGIGTAPSAVLHIYNQYDVTADTDKCGIRMTRVAGGSQSWLWSLGQSAVSNDYFGLRDITHGVYKMMFKEGTGTQVMFGNPSNNGTFGASNTVLSIKGSTSGGEGILQITGLGNNATDNVGRIDFHSQAEADPMCSIRSVRGNADDVGDLEFHTNSGGGAPSTRMIITSDGIVGIGDLNPTLATRLVIAASSGSGNVCDIRTGTTANTNVGAIVFRNSASAYCGQITVNGATGVTSYLSASDYRLKEDLKDFKGLDLVSNIKVYDYKWKSADERTYGVVAHELQEVLPQAVNGNKDDEQMQSVDYSKIVPLLVAAIQELKAEIELLKNK